MANFFRVCKPEMCSTVRSYKTHRYQQNHYEVLDVSPNASQKDIRRAFIKLSKQLHPDASGKHSHADFVKLNEAYSVLGKENTRRQYDIDLKYGCNPYTYTCPRNTQYGSQWEYEVRTAGGPWPPPKQKPDASLGLIIALLFCGMGIFQFILILHRMKVKKRLNSQDKLEREYQHVREIARIKSKSMNRFTSLADFEQYLKKDDR